MRSSYLSLGLSLLGCSAVEARSVADDTPLPVVIWHGQCFQSAASVKTMTWVLFLSLDFLANFPPQGLGDSFDRMAPITDLLNRVHEGTYTKVVKLGTSPAADSEATFVGNVSAQVDQVCAELAADNILSTAPAIDALGFSQGGLFLRAYVERCRDGPAVRSLVTLGSPHNGITEVSCRNNVVCHGLYWLFKLNPFAARVQSTVVPAQYYRPAADSAKFADYLESSGLLADVNNERTLKDKAYADAVAGLDALVMVMFEQDTQVVPKESAWFEDSDGPNGVSTPLRARELYRDDWLGLRRLDRNGGLHFRSVDGEHMQFEDEFLEGLASEFFGPERKKKGGDGDSKGRNVVADL